MVIRVVVVVWGEGAGAGEGEDEGRQSFFLFSPALYPVRWYLCKIMIPGERDVDAGGSEISKVEKPSGYSRIQISKISPFPHKKKKKKKENKGQNKKQTNTRPNTLPLLLMLAGRLLPYGSTSIGPDWTGLD